MKATIFEASMSDLEFKDQSTNHKYRTELPNIIFELGLSPNEFMLYSSIKKCAGDGGACTKSILSLAKMCNLSERTIDGLLKSISKVNEFIKKPLIIITKRKTECGDKDTHMITITDLWEENYSHFIGGSADSAPPSAEFTLGGAENSKGVAQILRQGSAESAHKEEPFNKEDKEEENIARSPTSSTPRPKDSLSFDFISKKFIGIEKQDFENWKVMYPHIQVNVEILKASEWLLANPSKSSRSLWRKYLTTWFRNADNHMQNKKAYKSNTATADRRTRNTDGTPSASPVDGLF